MSGDLLHGRGVAAAVIPDPPAGVHRCRRSGFDRLIATIAPKKRAQAVNPVEGEHT